MGSTPYEPASEKREKRTWYVLCQATGLVAAGAKTITFPRGWNAKNLNHTQWQRWDAFRRYCDMHKIEIRYRN